ncbi:MAG: DNA-binding protein, partial [Clostridium sp.]
QDGGIPKEYQLQVQHYLAVCGLKRAYIAVLIGGNHFLYYQVERDEEMIEKLLEAEKDFWEAHVLADVPPVPDDSKATSKYLDEKYSDPVEDIVRLDAEMKVTQEYQAIAR